MTNPTVVADGRVLVPVEAGLFSNDPPGVLAGRCGACGTLRFPPRKICPACQKPRIEEVVLASPGFLYTFTVVRSAPPGYLGDVPYAIGVVELPEGLRLTATITAAELDLLAVGDRVEPRLLELGSGERAVLSFAYHAEHRP